MHVLKQQLSHTHTHTLVTLLGKEVKTSVHGDLSALWPHYYSKPAVRRWVLLCSQCSSPSAKGDDVHEWEGCGVSAASSPISPPLPSLPPPTLQAHFLLGDIQLCFLSGCPRPQTRGASSLVGTWSSLSKDTSLFHTHEKKNKTWGWHRGSSSAILSHIVFAACLFYAYFHFLSSLSSAQAINSVNWLSLSLVHWLRSLIKGLLIGTLFNTGPCRESCPPILSRQQPFPVCQSFNVINYVNRLGR